MNQLTNSTSPYLQQHKNNPVDWRVWGIDALNEAKNDGLPILLSIGYAACHWCHVMAHESFESEEIAEIINKNFIPIKVDREERPEIDALYMEALNDLGIAGGWPLTMFLDSSAQPFWGGTYFPHPARGNMIGFEDVLIRVTKLWNEQPEMIVKNSEALQKVAIARLGRKRQGKVAEDLPKRMASQLEKSFDEVRGGFRGATKFANVPMLEFLWQQNYDEFVIKTLNSICLGGIYDHIGGGVARYSVDENWHIPHFEKMLYDNAMLVSLLSEVWRKTPIKLFEVRVHEIIEFLTRELLTENGFAASVDADSVDENGTKREGAFYVWRENEIDNLLGNRATNFKQAYNVVPDGNWIEEGVNVLFLKNYDDDFKSEKKTLFDTRQKRPSPSLDGKIIASWNGLAVEAITKAGLVFNNKDWIELAEDIFKRLTNCLVNNNDLAHSYCDGKLIAPALLDDLAAMMFSALALYRATKKESYLTSAKKFLSICEKHYKSSEGGFYLSADNVDDVPLGEAGRLCVASDSVMPAANSLILRSLTMMFAFEGNRNYVELSENIITAFGGDVVKNFAAHSSWLVAKALWYKNIQIILVGDDGTLAEILVGLDLSFVPIIKIAADEKLNAAQPSFQKPAINGMPTAYICLADKCLEPITDAKKLVNALANI